MRIITYYPAWIAIFLFWSIATGVLFAYHKQTKDFKTRIRFAIRKAAGYSLLIAAPIFVGLAILTTMF